MKTWYSKKEQKWVSDIPDSFWTGITDYRTGEKIYSDDLIYERWINNEINDRHSIYIQQVFVNYNSKYPVFNIRKFENLLYFKK